MNRGDFQENLLQSFKTAQKFGRGRGGGAHCQRENG